MGVWQLFTVGRSALAGQGVLLSRPVGAVQQDACLVVGVVAVAAAGAFDGDGDCESDGLVRVSDHDEGYPLRG